MTCPAKILVSHFIYTHNAMYWLFLYNFMFLLGLYICAYIGCECTNWLYNVKRSYEWKYDVFW